MIEVERESAAAVAVTGVGFEREALGRPVMETSHAAPPLAVRVNPHRPL